MEVWEEFLESANDDYNKGRYTVAVRNYATAIFLLIDKYLREKHNVSVKSHQDRFHILKELSKNDMKIKKILEIYEITFEIYRKTYYIKLAKEEADILNKYVNEIRRII
ncbi:MAG: HEPN domain-containing protein [Nanopusillaceae archaeon]